MYFSKQVLRLKIDWSNLDMFCCYALCQIELNWSHTFGIAYNSNTLVFAFVANRLHSSGLFISFSIAFFTSSLFFGL